MNYAVNDPQFHKTGNCYFSIVKKKMFQQDLTFLMSLFRLHFNYSEMGHSMLTECFQK